MTTSVKARVVSLEQLPSQNQQLGKHLLVHFSLPAAAISIHVVAGASKPRDNPAGATPADTPLLPGLPMDPEGVAQRIVEQPGKQLTAFHQRPEPDRRRHIAFQICRRVRRQGRWRDVGLDLVDEVQRNSLLDLQVATAPQHPARRDGPVPDPVRVRDVLLPRQARRVCLGAVRQQAPGCLLGDAALPDELTRSSCSTRVGGGLLA